MMKQKGNALFLILIAVALFAALSYAVTQSGRGGGNIDREQLELDVAQFANEVASVQFGMQRLLTSGYSIDDIQICDGGVAYCDNGIYDPLDPGNVAYCSTGSDCLFAPDGGGARVPEIPESFAAIDGFAIGFYVQKFGTPTEMWIRNIQEGIPSSLLIDNSVCAAINEALGEANDNTIPTVSFAKCRVSNPNNGDLRIVFY